jgi:2'-phosphotransferase
VLRHRAVELGLPMTPDGFVPCASLLRLHRFVSYSLDDITAAVAACPKRRFEMKVDESGNALIRATQGHSISGLDEERIFRKVEHPSELPVCVHGTYRKFWDSIKVGRFPVDVTL